MIDIYMCIPFMILKIEAIIETLFNITATSITLEKNIYQKKAFVSYARMSKGEFQRPISDLSRIVWRN